LSQAVSSASNPPIGASRNRFHLLIHAPRRNQIAPRVDRS
jgi:hypothetical protein